MVYPIRITLFFTYGFSLKKWAKDGLLQREIKLYHELINRFDVQVQFITYGDTSDRNWENELGAIKILPVYEKMRRPRSTILAYLQTILIPWYFRKELRQTDLFKTNQIWGGWVAVLAKWVFSKPLLVRCGYEDYKNSLKAGKRSKKQFILKYVSLLAYRQATHIWINTKEISNFIQRTYKVLPQFITIHPNWIDTDKFKPIHQKNIRSNRILYVGRFSIEKNIPILFQALVGTGIGVDLVGDGDLRPKLQQLALRLELDVNFLGIIPNDRMPEVYNRYPIYVLFSCYEGNPKTLLEAMSCGATVIGTDVPGIREIIHHNKNGLLAPEDASALRAAIQNPLADKTLRQKLGTNAYKYILNNNSMEKAVAKEYAIYRKIIN